MKNLLVLLTLLLSFNLAAKDLKIEEDQVFKTMLSEFQKPGSNLALYQESENYRFDLSLVDVIDKATLILEDMRFAKYQKDLNQILDKGNIYFYDWFLRLKEIANQDEELFAELDKKLFLQLYSRDGHAILPEYKFIDIQKVKDLGLLRRVTRYNEFISNPEGRGMAAAFALTEQGPFRKGLLTVAKLKEVKDKELKKIRKTYYSVYGKLVKRQYLYEQSKSELFTKLSFVHRKKGLKAIQVGKYREGVKYREFGNGLKLFNIINRVSHKQNLLTYVAQDLATQNIEVPIARGHIILTPIFIERNWEKVQKSIQAFTLKQMMNVEDDEYLYLVRTWVKRNYDELNKKLDEYNKKHKTNHAFNFRPNKRPKRIETIVNYQLIEELYPTKPWMRKDGPDVIDRKGRAKYFDQTFTQSVGRRFKSMFQNLIKVENYTSLISGTTVFVVTGGNAAMALSTRSLVKKAVYTMKHDREWKEFLESAPADVLGAFLLGSGFTAGRLYKILALGSAQGALQSLVTGQDIKTGAFVGAGLNLVQYYVLPYSIAKPMTKGIDAKSLRMNRILEVTATTVKSSLHGGLVATFTGEDILKGTLKGALYGSVSSTLAIWFLGTRYYPFRDFSDEDVDAMINAENAFQNDVGRGGLYDIDRQLILDANYRVNGALPDLITASIALPGNVSMSDRHFSSLTTLTHEASHLMQQHQSGVFGFYLFRYIPTSFVTGYKGHPDENFLRNFLSQYLNA